MAFIDLTTKARIKTILEDIVSTTHDALLDQLIAQVSAAMDKYLNRHIKQEERTEFFRIEEFQTLVSLRGYPIDTGATFEAHSDSNREYDSSSLVDSDNFGLDDEIGLIEFDQITLEPGSRALRIKYTGGMATNTANLITAFPDVAMACEMQVKWLFKRRSDDGLTAVQGEGGSITMFPQLNLVPEARRLVDLHRRVPVGI